MELRDLSVADLPAAGFILSRSMRDNPIHVAAFGGDSHSRERTLQRFFVPMLEAWHARGSILGAFDGGVLLGLVVAIPPGRCRIGLGLKLRVGASVLPGNRTDVLVRTMRWGQAWARHDLREPHWHLGPMGIDPHVQSQGVGRVLFTSLLERLDELDALSFAEVDRLQNLEWYRRLGFTVVGESRVLGITNWYITRLPRAGQVMRLRSAA
jgi:ribosomal protein S18 acetylase RimI-like enzyme